MGRLIVSEFVTLDGVFEDPGGAEGKPYGGWQIPLMGSDEEAYKMAELQAADALLLGRVTYDGFAAAWPAMENAGEFGVLMNDLPKYVATLTVSEFKWNNTQALAADAVVATRKLKEEYERDILVAGSGTLVHTLLDNNLVDELRLMTYPILLGEGRRLLDGLSRRRLGFVSERTFQNGTVLLTYTQTA
jgi:dihydrofolate reductase